MRKISVSIGEEKYPILIENGLLDQLGKEIKKIYQGKKIVIITDQNVNDHYGKKVVNQLTGEGFTTKIVVLPPGESTKSFDNLQNIYNELLEFKLTRSDLIIALGGGVIGDIAGFVAATFLRGVTFVQIPTSLLAQVDSSVGGKVGINLPQGKNLVGAFCQPTAVFIDPSVLDTLTGKFFKGGMAEVIKYGCIKDKAFFNLLKGLSSRQEIMAHIEEIVYDCCMIKKKVVEQDEKDQGERLLLNFGHTLGHAIEKCHHYTGITHGEAVAIGMYHTTLRSEQMGMTKSGTAENIKEILIQYGLPYELNIKDRHKLIGAIGLDKKNTGGVLKEILLTDIGESIIYDTTCHFFEI